jgi:CRP-like cAMP-binding protein
VELITVAEQESFAPGSLIVAQGGAGDAFYVISEGEAVVYQVGVDGEDRLGGVGGGIVHGE